MCALDHGPTPCHSGSGRRLGLWHPRTRLVCQRLHGAQSFYRHSRSLSDVTRSYGLTCRATMTGPSAAREPG
jgi:hypothetical protein